MTHALTSPYYPQSNGKIERWHPELKQTIRPRAPSSVREAMRLVADFVEYYNFGRLHSALGYVTPYDRLPGLDDALQTEREHKIKAAAAKRQAYWRQLAPTGLKQKSAVLCCC